MHCSRLLSLVLSTAMLILPDPLVSQEMGTARSADHGARSGVVPDARHSETRSMRAGFTLEQIVRTRTLGQFTLSRGGRTAAYTVSGYYLQFPVIPRFGDDNNIHVVDIESGEVTQLTSGARPKTKPVFSPSGTHVAFEADNDIWVSEVASGETRRLTMTVFRAQNSQPTWSPDGGRLAFISDRGGQTDLWVMAATGDRHEARQLTDDAAVESDPQWSPNGDEIAVSVKMPGEPYMATAILLIPAEGGAAARLTPHDATDNFAPRWSPDGRRLAFLSDRSGYVHVWTMSRAGTDLREFDTGPYDSMSPYFDVRPVWSPDGSRIMISVNTEGQFRLAVLEEASGDVEWVGREPGHYHEVGWGSDGSLVYSYENAWSPPDLYARSSDGIRTRRLTHSSHAAFREDHFARTRTVSFPSSDGLEVPAFLLTARELAPGERLPAIVLMHPNSYGQSYRDNWNPFPHHLVQRGYVVLMVNHRGGAGYGREFRELLTGNWGTGTFEDVKAGAAFLKDQPFVDPDRVGIMGLSMGGYHTLLGITKAPDLFHAAVDLMGITDMRSPFRPYRVAVSEADDPERYERISPITTADQIRVPLFIIHSDEDRNVVPQQTYHLVDELDRLGKDYDLRMYYGEAHGLADPDHQLDSFQRIEAFFDRHLKN